jgi:hypothetical protein
LCVRTANSVVREFQIADRLVCENRRMTTTPATDPTIEVSPGRAREAGARWWSIDIHAHSPASFDYGGLEGRANDEPKPSFKEWIAAYIAAGIDGIVVTDHNSHEGIEPARQALEDLRRIDPHLPPLVIFPGVEMTATGGIHILGIFDPTCTADVVNQALAICRYGGTRGTSDETANATVSDIAAELAGLGAVCIPAHADQAKGVFTMDPRDLTALATSPHVDAVEVVDDANLATASRLDWVPVLGSDAHHLTTDSCPNGDAKAPGTHLTLIKAEVLNLDGLRLALTDPKESVRRCRSGYIDPNVIDHGHINRIQIVQGESAEEYRFSPWMNCLIGGRGVGKSTVIELLRLALGRSHELEGTVAEDLRRFHPDSDPRERWWNEETRIVVDYTKDERLLRVSWSGADPSKPELELWTGNDWQMQSGRAMDRAPIRVFSQKQIYELASSPQSFLTILDDMPPIQRNEWDEENEGLQLRFKGERNKLRQLLAETEKADRIRGQLEEVRGRLRHLAELRESSEYQELEATETRLRDAANAEQRATTVEQRLAADADVLRTLATESLKVEEFAARTATYESAAELMKQAAAVLAAGRAHWENENTSRSWEARVRDLNTWMSEQGGSSRTSAEQTSADRQREAALEAELRDVEGSEERRAQQQSVIDQIYEDIASKRTELHNRRRGYTEQLNATPGSPTKVEVHHQGAIENLGHELRTLLNCPESFDSAFGQDGVGASLIAQEPRDPRFPARVETFKKALVEFVESGAESEIGGSIRVDARFYSRLDGADTFDLITNIMLWFPEDLVSVRYKPRHGGNFIAVDRGSPGQKTAALLTVILQMGSDPLLLDQPEDDLENKLIRHLAVETLKSIKSHRQLIVSTHNANIVVTSAAENIIVLQHGDLVPRIEVEGTLQVTGVKANVCEILEGGEEAITTRYRRLVGPVSA